MSILPAEAEALLLALAPVSTEPPFHRFVTLPAVVLLTTGRRVTANLPRAVGALTATSGSSPPCWSACPSPAAPGPWPCWSIWTAPSRTTGPAGAAVAATG